MCEAPALPLQDACVFCRSPLEAEMDLAGLLDYLAKHLPGAELKRRGVARRGAVRELRSGEKRARLGRGGLELTPDVPPAEWVDGLLAEMSRRAAADAGLRRVMMRAGWALR